MAEVPENISSVQQNPVGAASSNLMPFSKITGRVESTRSTSFKHVSALTDSIAAVGLIQPIAVDGQGKLLAGGHRMAALAELKEKRKELFYKLFPDELVPVRVLELENGESGTRKALEIELSENEKRRDYTGKEILGLIARLKKAGYGTSTGGRREKNDKRKHLTEALATVLGRSRRQAQRMLNASESASKPTAKEAATARCLRVMAQALEAAAAEGTLDSTERALAESLEKKVQELKHRQSSSSSDKVRAT